jgi:hypothetical protein
MTTTLLAKSQTEVLRILGDLSKQFFESGAKASAAIVETVNIGRQMGFYFQELCNHEQMTLDFFQKVSGKLPDGINFGTVQKCIWLSRNMAEPAVTYADIPRAACQMAFTAAGFLEEPHREVAQSSSGDSPVAWMLSTFSGIEARFKKLDFADMPMEARETALDEIVRLRDNCATWEAKLKQSLSGGVA